MQQSYYHAIMFDFDGTLVDTMHDYAEIASNEMHNCFKTPKKIAKELYLETSGVPFFEQLEIIYGANSLNSKCSKMFEYKKSIYLQNLNFSLENKKTIQNIRSLGLSMSITSNNYQNHIDIFINKNPGLFDLSLGYGNGLSKGPTQFSRVIDTFGIDRRNLLFVGDSLSDVRKALAFGIDIVAISGTLKKEAFNSIFQNILIISNLSDLIPLLKKINPYK